MDSAGISTNPAACGSIGPVTRMTRATSKAMTRERLLAEAQRLFRERGYAATSLEQIAEAADVTKGAIYGHFSSKEDLLLSAIEAVPLRERLGRFGRAMAVDEAVTDKAGLAVELEFIAALLRNPEALRRYSADLTGRLAELAGADEDEPSRPTTALEAWAIGHSLLIGLQVYRCVAPEVLTPAVFARAFELLAG